MYSYVHYYVMCTYLLELFPVQLLFESCNVVHLVIHCPSDTDLPG